MVTQEDLSKIPVRIVDNGSDKVYKDECCYSFDNPESVDGLYVSMFSFLGYSKRFALQYANKTGNKLFVHIKRIRYKLDNDDGSEPQAPKRLAIGLEGGIPLDDQKVKIEEHFQIVVLPEETTFQLTDNLLPTGIKLSADSIIAAEAAFRKEELNAATGTWDGEARVNSKHSNTLVQLSNGVKIPPSGWKCSRCDLRENLWLNLTDGAINCGRQFFDGSGGNNHAIAHYNETKYPLAVKLGTINYKGADVYSYDEDDMVVDTNLEKHLSHFGIDVASMQKTEKSMAELELDMNQRIGEWALCTEEGCKLEPLFGSGYTGLHNLGNSCYMNSVLQMIFTIPSFVQKYFEGYDSIIADCGNDPNTDLRVQMAKLAHGILSGSYSQKPANETEISGIKPQSFKLVVGKNHPEFSSKRQQDAEEFLRYFLDILEKNDKNNFPGNVFKFNLQERIECGATKKVAYKKRSECVLGLTVNMNLATNKAEFEAFEEKKKQVEANGGRIDPKDIVLAKIPLGSCLSAFSEPQYVEDFYSSAAQAKVTAKTTTSFLTFPDYLIVQMRKFTLTENWTPKKLDVSIDVPDVLDLTGMKTPEGIQPGESAMPNDNVPKVNIDQAVVDQLVGMGFPVEGCKKAVYNTNNQGVEAAMQWVMDHMGDVDFGDPFIPPGGAPAKTKFVANEESVQMVMGMGFSRQHALKALEETQNNVERAIDWIFSHQDELNNPPPVTSGAGGSGEDQPPSTLTDGAGKYTLVGFITHMGSSTSSGHYVCHLYKDSRWVIFNDEKVALSERPPKDLAYLYLYKRSS